MVSCFRLVLFFNLILTLSLAFAIKALAAAASVGDWRGYWLLATDVVVDLARGIGSQSLKLNKLLEIKWCWLIYFNYMIPKSIEDLEAPEMRSYILGRRFFKFDLYLPRHFI